MANTIRDYSATAASNTVVDGADISEGCSPAGINDAIRGVMADLKDVSTGAVALESPAMDSLTVDTTGIVYSGGNVGINTTTMHAGLNIKQSADNAYQIKLEQANTTDGYGLICDMTDGALAFSRYASSAYTESMRITDIGCVAIGGSVTSVFNGVGDNMKLVVIGDDSTTTVANNSDAGIAIVNTNQTAGNLAGLHFARADTDDSPNYAGASIVAQFPDAQVTGQYPKGELAFLTSTNTNNAPSEKVRIDASGNLLLGYGGQTTTAFAAPQGITIASLDNVALQYFLRKGNQVEAHIGFKSSTDTNFYVGTSGGTGPGGIGVYGVYQTNTSTSWSAVSDETQKTIVGNIENASEKVSTLRTVMGYYNTDETETHKPFLIAQDVQAVLPEAVSIADVETGILGLSYTDVIPLLTAAIKEQRTMIQELEARIATLEAN